MLRNLRRLICRRHKGLDRCLHATTSSIWQSNTVANEGAQLPPEKPRSICRTAENDPGSDCYNPEVMMALRAAEAVNPDRFCVVVLSKATTLGNLGHPEANHTEDVVGQYYTIPLEEVAAVFPHGLPTRFKLQVTTLKEASFMVRKPALELINYLKHTNFAHPAIRYIIYGEQLTGKTMTLCHAVHYCARQNWLILHIPDVFLWMKNCKQVLPSTYKAQRFDQPLEASAWLKNFKITNQRFLNEIKTKQKYVWNKRESTEEGRPLGEVIDQGLIRIRNATDVVGVVFKELKQQCQQGAFKLLVAVDGVNGLWGRTAVRKPDKTNADSEELALLHNLRKMVANDWTGGAIVTTVTQTGAPYTARRMYLPYDLLGKEGFEAFAPFVPIQVFDYSDREFEGCYQYYLENKWLQHEKAGTTEGRLELRFLSGRNPGLFERISASF